MWNQIYYHTYFAWFLLLFLNVAFKNIWNCMCNMAIPKGCLGSVPVSPATSTRMLQESLPLVSCLSVSGVRTSGPSSLSLWSRLWTAPCSHPPTEHLALGLFFCHLLCFPDFLPAPPHQHKMKQSRTLAEWYLPRKSQLSIIFEVQLACGFLLNRVTSWAVSPSWVTFHH